MTRRIVISLVAVATLFAAIGAPVNVHACAMAGTVERAPGCGMCADAGDDDRSGGCCDDHLEFEQTDDARMLDASIRLVPPPILAVLPWPTSIVLEPVTCDRADLFRSDHPPPDLSDAPLFLQHSSLLI